MLMALYFKYFSSACYAHVVRDEHYAYVYLVILNPVQNQNYDISWKLTMLQFVHVGVTGEDCLIV